MSPVLSEDMTPVLLALESRGQTNRFVSDWRDVLDTEKPELAVVNPPFHLLGSVIKQCLERGIAVLGEKPLAINAIELAEIRSLAQNSNAPKLMAMLNMRYLPEYHLAHKFISDGGLGDLLLMTAQKSYPIRGWDGKPRPTFFHKRITYGGTIPWIGIHLIDQFLWFTKSRFTEVTASHSTFGNKSHGEMETMACMNFKLASGVLAQAHLDYLHQGPSNSWGDDRLRVVGEKGILEIKGGIVTVQSDDKGIRTLQLPQSAKPISGFFSAFLSWVEEDIPMLGNTEDCLIAAEVSLKARDAADLGRLLVF